MAASNGKIYCEQDQALLDGRSKLKPSSASHEHEPLPLIQGHQYSTRSGSRVEALKAGQVGYFAATVLNDLGNGNVRVRFDDFAKDEDIALSDTRALVERRSYPDIKFRLDPNNVDEFEHQVFYRALRRGKGGLKFIEFNKTHGEEIKALTKIEIKKTEVKTEVSITSDGVIREAIAKFIANDGSGVVNSGSAEEKVAAQDLFAEILEMCPYQDFLRYQLQGSYDEIGTSLQLFYCARNAALYRRAKRDALANELHSEHGCFACKQSSFTIFDGVREMLQGNYILESWRQAPDAADAYNDVVALNQNLGLIAALILTIAIPQGLNANGITDQSESTYIGFVSLTEGLAVLVTTRNLIALNALEPENIKPYLAVAQSVLLMPIRLNFVAVLALFGALNLWCVAQNGFSLWLGFFFLIVVPTLWVFFKTTGAGIMHLYAVQPWRSRKKPFKKATQPSEESHKSN